MSIRRPSSGAAASIGRQLARHGHRDPARPAGRRGADHHVGRHRPGHTLDLTLPITAYGAMLEGALGGPKAIANTLNAATPLIFAGLAGGLRLPGRPVQHRRQRPVPAWARFSRPSSGTRSGCRSRSPSRSPSLLAGALGGAAWGFIPGALKAWRGAHEVVTTIMLNSIAYLLVEPPGEQHLQGPDGDVPANARHQPGGCPRRSSSPTPACTAASCWRCSPRSPSGSCCSRPAGLRDPDRGGECQRGTLRRHPAVVHHRPHDEHLPAASPAWAAASRSSAITKNYPAEYLVNFGFDGIAVALLGRAHPLGVIGAALLFGIMRAGAGSMQRATDIPVDIISIVQGVILLFVAAQVVIQRLLPAARRVAAVNPRLRRRSDMTAAASAVPSPGAIPASSGAVSPSASSSSRCSPCSSTCPISAASSTG